MGFRKENSNRGMVIERIVSFGVAGLFVWLCVQANPSNYRDVGIVPIQTVSAFSRNVQKIRGSSPHVLSEREGHRGSATSFMSSINRMRERLNRNPRDAEALIALGNANFDIQRFDKARDLYLTFLGIDPLNLHVRTDLASSYRNLGDVESAIQALRVVLKNDPSHETALYNLGVIFLNDRQDPDKAIGFWETLIDQHPQSTIAVGLKQKIAELRPIKK